MSIASQVLLESGAVVPGVPEARCTAVNGNYMNPEILNLVWLWHDLLAISEVSIDVVWSSVHLSCVIPTATACRGPQYPAIISSSDVSQLVVAQPRVWKWWTPDWALSMDFCVSCDAWSWHSIPAMCSQQATVKLTLPEAKLFSWHKLLKWKSLWLPGVMRNAPAYGMLVL